MNEKTDANAEMTEMLQLSNKVFKAGIQKYFNEQLGTLLKQMEKNSLSKDIDPIKKNQMKILELQNTLNETECSVDGLNIKRRKEENFSSKTRRPSRKW